MMSGEYLLQQNRNLENLENLDRDTIMYRVDCTLFSQIFLKNLLEKGNSLEMYDQGEIYTRLARWSIPSYWTLDAKIRIFAESLGCALEKTDYGWNVMKTDELTMHLVVEDGKVAEIRMSFCSSPFFESPEALNLLHRNKWMEFRDNISIIMSRAKTSREIRRQSAMAMLEKFFDRYSAGSTYIAIQESIYGYYLKPTDLRQGRLYYMVHPLYRSDRSNEGVFDLCEEDYDDLPYIEFSFDKNDSSTLPENNAEVEWSETIEADAAICLKFPKGILISEATRNDLEKYCGQSATICYYTNSYRHALGEPQIEDEHYMITKFTDGKTQHCYKINVRSFTNEGDSVITDICLNHLQDLHLVIAILRKEVKHLCFWESVRNACLVRQGFTDYYVHAIMMFVRLERQLISICFYTSHAMMRVNIKESETSESRVEVVDAFTGERIFVKRVNDTLSQILNETWSIPTMLNALVCGEDCLMSTFRVLNYREGQEAMDQQSTSGDF